MYKFKSNTPNLTMWVGDVKVSFTPNHYGIGGGYYYTANSAIANKIRASKKFGRFIFEEDLDGNAAPAAEEKVYEHIHEEVTKTQEARDLLKETYGVEKGLRTRSEVLAAAEELSISFPNLK